MFVVPDASDGENGSAGPGQALPLGPVVISKCDCELDRFFTRPRRERRLGRVRPAVRGGREWGALASEEFQFGVFERELRVVFERRDDLPRSRSRATLPASLTRTPETGSFATRYIATSEDRTGFLRSAPAKFCGAAR